MAFWLSTEIRAQVLIAVQQVLLLTEPLLSPYLWLSTTDFQYFLLNFFLPNFSVSSCLPPWLPVGSDLAFCSSLSCGWRQQRYETGSHSWALAMLSYLFWQPDRHFHFGFFWSLYLNIRLYHQSPLRAAHPLSCSIGIHLFLIWVWAIYFLNSVMWYLVLSQLLCQCVMARFFREGCRKTKASWPPTTDWQFWVPDILKD